MVGDGTGVEEGVCISVVRRKKSPGGVRPSGRSIGRVKVGRVPSKSKESLLPLVT